MLSQIETLKLPGNRRILLGILILEQTSLLIKAVIVGRILAGRTCRCCLKVVNVILAVVADVAMDVH